MASIKGITIDIGGNTTKLTDALKNVNKVVFSTNTELRQLNQALKLDPKNTELLSQKQDVLKKNIEATVERLQSLKEAQRQMGDYSKLTEEQKEQYRALSVEITKSESALKTMGAEMENARNGNAFNALNDGIEKVGQTSIKVGDLIKANLASEAIVRVFDNIVGKVKNISSAIGDMVISGGMDRALNLENAKAKMSTFTKSTKQLDTIMKNVEDSVDGTAFSMDSAATVAAGLFAAGIKEGDEMEKSLKLVGDAAQVSGRSMEDIGSIFNKVAANGKLTGQELNQLSDSGIPVLQLLSQSMGKSTEEVRKMVSTGKIGFAEFSEAMQQGLGGAAQNAGQTFTSSLANLKSAMSRVGAELMTPLLEGITPVMNTTKDMIKKMVRGEDISGEIDNLFKQLENFANKATEHLSKMIDKYIPVISQMLQGIIQMIPKLLPQLVPLITDLITNIATLIFNNLPLIINTLLQVVTQLAFALGNMLPTLIPQVIDCILDIVDNILNNIDLIIDAGIELIIGLAEGLVEGMPKLIEKLPEIIIKIVEAIIRNLPKIIEAGFKLIGALAEGFIRNTGAIITGILKIIEAIKTKMSELPEMALEWGKDMIDGFIKGIKKMLSKVGDAAKDVGEKIKKFLHFSKPDEGPLRDYETWMPDMMKGLAKGINKYSYLVENATDNLATQMANRFAIDDLIGNTNNAMKTLNYGVNNSSNPLINPNASNNQSINGKNTIFTTPNITFNVQEMTKENLEECFNYINKKFGSNY